jgi:hypothetical protein
MVTDKDFYINTGVNAGLTQKQAEKVYAHITQTKAINPCSKTISAEDCVIRCLELRKVFGDTSLKAEQNTTIILSGTSNKAQQIKADLLQSVDDLKLIEDMVEWDYEQSCKAIEELPDWQRANHTVGRLLQEPFKNKQEYDVYCKLEAEKEQIVKTEKQVKENRQRFLELEVERLTTCLNKALNL